MDRTKDRRNPLTCAAVLVALTALVALNPGCAWFNQMAAKSAGWTKFVSTDGGFSVQVPTEPNAQTRTVPTDVGHLAMKIYVSEDPAGASAYAVVYTDYPRALMAKATPQQILDGSADEAKANPNQEVKEFRESWMGNVPGRSMEIHDKRGFVTHSRVYLAGSRLYSVAATVPADRPNSGHVDMFLDSFQILDR